MLLTRRLVPQRVNIHPVYIPQTPHTSLCELFMVQGPRLDNSVLQHAGFWVFRGQLKSYSLPSWSLLFPLYFLEPPTCVGQYSHSISALFLSFSAGLLSCCGHDFNCPYRVNSESSYCPQGSRDQFELGMQVWPSWLINHSPSTLPQCRNAFFTYSFVLQDSITSSGKSSLILPGCVSLHGHSASPGVSSTGQVF